jgi:excisionase family DNA binding protein
MEDKALDTNAAAEYIGCSPSTLRLWRSQGRGPRYYPAGRLIRYRKSALDLWIEKNSREPWQANKNDDKEKKED